MQDELFLVFWDGYGERLGERMILCGDRADVDGWGGGAGVGCPIGRKSDRRRRGRDGFIFKICNNKQRNLGLEW